MPRKNTNVVEYDFNPRISIKTHTHITAKTSNQARFVKSLKNNTITFGYGDPGTGKSLLALYNGVSFINNPSSPIERIIYIRPNVGVKNERDVGFLKGSLLEKLYPLAAPALDNLIEFMSESDSKAMVEFERIVPLTVALIRGRSFRNSFIIIDEAQNISIDGLKACITRISEGSKMAIIGDVDQADLSELICENGLSDGITRFAGLDNLGIIRFDKTDIQRHPIISDVLSRY